MGSKKFTVTYQYKNGIPDGMVIEDAKTPNDATTAVIVYTTGVGILKNIQVRETVASDAEYLHLPALEQIGE
jgi:hypothetical protein